MTRLKLTETTRDYPSATRRYILSAWGILLMWSPCGRFIAASFRGVIQIQDSNTLERLSVFDPPRLEYPPSDEFLAFSPDGRLLAYVFEFGDMLVAFPVSASTLTSVPRRPSACISVWDVQTGVAIINIDIKKSGKLLFSGDCRTITLLDSYGTFSTYDGVNGTYICGGKLPASPPRPPIARWAYEESVWSSTSSKSDGKFMVSIQEFRPTSTPPFHVVESFSASLHKGEFSFFHIHFSSISFSHVSFHASFTFGAGVFILDLRDSRTLLEAEAVHSTYTSQGRFSPDGCFFACGTQEGEICIWKNSSANYVDRKSVV